MFKALTDDQTRTGNSMTGPLSRANDQDFSLAEATFVGAAAEVALVALTPNLALASMPHLGLQQRLQAMLEF